MASNFYDDEITDASFEELKKFLNWMNLRGTYPTIIGGWAVFAYEGGIGSRDIDVVMPDTNTINQLLEDDYFEKNQYHVVMKGLIPDHYEKIVKTARGDTDIKFDVFNAEILREDSENLGISFHWGWTLQSQEKKTIEDLDLYVPTRELLIISKIIAAVARTEEFRLKPNPRLPSKIWKDYRDVAVLTVNKNIEKGIFGDYLKKSGLEPHLSKFVSGYQDSRYNSILTDLHCDFDYIQNSLNLK